MRRPEAMARTTLLVLLASVLLLSACNRLTFVKPSTGRGRYEQVAHEVRIDPKASARGNAFTMTQVAQSRLLSGDAKGALDAALRAIKADPGSATANSLAALSLDALGRAAEAGPHHRRAAELDSARGELLNNYGTWLCSNGQAATSLDWFERAAAAPGYATPAGALANAAACALEAGQTPRAERAARQALDLDRRTPCRRQVCTCSSVAPMRST
ncbi:hypothetical protein, partial [Lysobacter xanthus]